MNKARVIRSQLTTKLFVGACCAVLGFYADAARAADPATAKPDSSNSDAVVVTARRVAENVQRVPLTVNVLTPKVLAREGVQSLDQISNLVPNLIWTDDGGSAFQKITIRGIPSNDSLVAFDPGVGVYIDDVYQPSSLTFNSALLDIASVQVLKGPQGTLFGRNTDAGAIVITTVKPTTDGYYVKADTDIGNYNYWQGRLVANMPLADNLALKVSGIYASHEGYETNLVTNSRNVNNENHYGGMAQLLYSPSPQTHLLGEFYYFKDTGAQNNPSCFGGGAFGNFCATNPTEASTLNRKLYSNLPIESDRTMWGASLHANWNAPSGFLLTSITAYSYLNDVENQDQDYTSLDAVRSGFTAPGQWQFSEEFRATSPQDRRLRGTMGLFYSHEYSPVNSPVTFEGGALPLLGITGFPSLSTSTPAEITTDSFAAFGQGQFSITPKLIAEAGLRYTLDAKSMHYQEITPPQLEVFAGPNNPGIPIAVPAFQVSHSWSAPSGTASLSYQFDDNLMAYARYSRGYKSGGFNANTSGNFNTPANPNNVVDAQKTPFNPEYLNSYEAGWKAQTPDHRVTFNFAAFFIEYQNLQVQVTTADETKLITNAPSAQSEGLEGEITWAPFDGLVLSANGGIENAHYVQFTTTFGGLGNLAGKRFPYSPPSSAMINGTYTHPLWSGWHGLVSLTAIYNGSMFLTPSDTQVAKEGAYEELNGRIGIESDDGRYGGYLWSNNMTNVARITSESGGVFASGLVTLNAPMTVGVELKGRF